MPATKTKLISLRVSPEVRQAFEAAAARDSRTLSNFLVMASLRALPADLHAKLERLAQEESAHSPATAGATDATDATGVAAETLHNTIATVAETATGSVSEAVPKTATRRGEQRAVV